MIGPFKCTRNWKGWSRVFGISYVLEVYFIMDRKNKLIETFIFINFVNLKHIPNSIIKADLCSFMYCPLQEYTDIQSRNWDWR